MKRKKINGESGWMQVDVTGRDEKVERAKGEILVRCRNENQKKRKN